MNGFTKVLIFGGVALAAYYLPTILAVLKMDVSIYSFNALKIESTYIQCGIGLKLKNLSNTRIDLQSISGKIYLNGIEVGNIDQVINAPIFPNNQQIVNIVFTLDQKAIGNEIWLQLIAMNLQNAIIEIKGTLQANNKTLPMDSIWTIHDITA